MEKKRTKTDSWKEYLTLLTAHNKTRSVLKEVGQKIHSYFEQGENAKASHYSKQFAQALDNLYSTHKALYKLEKELEFDKIKFELN